MQIQEFANQLFETIKSSPVTKNRDYLHISDTFEKVLKEMGVNVKSAYGTEVDVAFDQISSGMYQTTYFIPRALVVATEENYEKFMKDTIFEESFVGFYRFLNVTYIILFFEAASWFYPMPELEWDGTTPIEGFHPGSEVMDSESWPEEGEKPLDFDAAYEVWIAEGKPKDHSLVESEAFKAFVKSQGIDNFNIN
jgi:hypothetical protein